MGLQVFVNDKLFTYTRHLALNGQSGSHELVFFGACMSIRDGFGDFRRGRVPALFLDCMKRGEKAEEMPPYQRKNRD